MNQVILTADRRPPTVTFLPLIRLMLKFAEPKAGS